MNIKEHLPNNLNSLKKSKEDTIEELHTAIVKATKRKVKGIRGKKKQSDIAESAGLKQPAISRLENEDNNTISLSTLQQVAAAMDCVLVMDILPRSEVVDNLISDK